MPAAPAMLMTAPMAADSTAVSSPEIKDPDRQAVQNPATRRRPTPTYVEIAERAEKSAVGANQSNAVRATAATPNSVPQTHEPDHLVFICVLPLLPFAFSLVSYAPTGRLSRMTSLFSRAWAAICTTVLIIVLGTSFGSASI